MFAGNGNSKSSISSGRAQRTCYLLFPFGSTWATSLLPVADGTSPHNLVTHTISWNRMTDTPRGVLWQLSTSSSKQSTAQLNYYNVHAFFILGFLDCFLFLSISWQVRGPHLQVPVLFQIPPPLSTIAFGSDFTCLSDCFSHSTTWFSPTLLPKSLSDPPCHRGCRELVELAHSCACEPSCVSIVQSYNLMWVLYFQRGFQTHRM